MRTYVHIFFSAPLFSARGAHFFGASGLKRHERPVRQSHYPQESACSQLRIICGFHQVNDWCSK